MNPIHIHIRRTGRNPVRGPSADWWVLTSVATSAETNGLTCLLKDEEALDNKSGHPSDNRTLQTLFNLNASYNLRDSVQR
jgi:hypothetical protein